MLKNQSKGSKTAAITRSVKNKCTNTQIKRQFFWETEYKFPPHLGGQKVTSLMGQWHREEQ